MAQQQHPTGDNGGDDNGQGGGGRAWLYGTGGRSRLEENGSDGWLNR